MTAARWGEIRWAAGVCTVPAARMQKMRRDHRMPRCSRAVDILEEVRRIGGGGPLVFIVGDGKPMSKNRLRRKAPRAPDGRSAARIPVVVPGLGGRGDGRAPPANPRRAAAPHRTPRARSSPHMGLDADLSMADPFALPQQ